MKRDRTRTWQDDALVSRRDDGLLSAEVDGELLGMSVEKGMCYGFNASATRIWDLIETPARLDQICSQLMGEFDVDLATCRSDVTSMLDELDAAGLIEVSC